VAIDDYENENDMNDEMETLTGARHGSLRAVPPRDYRSDHKEPSYDETEWWDGVQARRRGPRLASAVDGRGVLLARARLVRDGIESVREVCGVSDLTAVVVLALEMGTTCGRVLAWAECGIKKEWLWKNWCKAVDALAKPWMPEITVEAPRPHEAFGNRLKAWRQCAGLSVAAAGRACGVRGCTYYKWEKGATKPSAQRMPRLRGLIDGNGEDGMEKGHNGGN